MSVRGSSRASAANRVASRTGSGPCRSSDQSASGCSLARLKTTSRASTPFRRSASTFAHGIPATLTGVWTTRSTFVTSPGTGHVPSGRVEFELVEVAQGRSAGADARDKRAQLVVGDLADRALDAEVRDVQ